MNAGNPSQANERIESPAQPKANPAANTNTQPATTAAAPTTAATTACPVPNCDANAKAVNTTKCDVCKCNPGFVGPGTLGMCGPDEDNDGWSDTALKCKEAACKQDNCVGVPNSGQ